MMNDQPPSSREAAEQAGAEAWPRDTCLRCGYRSEFWMNRCPQCGELSFFRTPWVPPVLVGLLFAGIVGVLLWTGASRRLLWTTGAGGTAHRQHRNRCPMEMRSRLVPKARLFC